MDIWTESLRRGDNVAYEELYKKYWRSMVFYTMKILGREEESNDVAQFAFIKLFENRKSIDSADHARNFLYNACKNRAISVSRLVSSRMTEIDEYMENTLAEEQHIDLDSVHTRLIEILATLPKQYRKAIMDRAERGDYGEGVLPNREYIRLSRARKAVIVKFKIKSNI